MNVDNNTELPSLSRLAETYDLIGKMIGDHSLMILRDKDRFLNFFSDYFSYERVKVENLSGLMAKRNEFATAFEKKNGNTLY